MARKQSIYFDDFLTMVTYSCEAAQYLQACLKDYKPSTLEARQEKMHQIEHTEDQVKHEMIKRLYTEFITPIDREDIIRLANELDDVTDKIDDILIRLFMYNVQSIRPEAIQFADTILRCCQALKVAITEFPNFQKSSSLKQAMIDVNTMEDEGDTLYIEAVRKLYATSKDPVEIAVWTKLFDRLEDCCDACEDVADTLETIVMKNS